MKRLKDNSQRAKNAILTMWLVLGAVVIGLLIEFYSLKTLIDINSGTYNIIGDFSTYLIIIGLAGFAVLAINVVTIVFFIMWFRRAYWNLHQLTKGLKYTEGWAAGAWFIPIFNYFGPYQIAKDLFTKSEMLLTDKGLISPDPKRFQTAKIWWGLWISSSILNSISSRADSLNSIEGQIAFGVLGLIGSIISIGAAIYAVKMIQSYNEMEKLLPQLSEDIRTHVDDNEELLDSGV